VELSLEASPLSIQADPAALGNAVWNLLDNAVKYSPGRSSIHVSVQRAGKNVAISVSDTGIGIPATEQKEIFAKFVRGAESKRQGIKGTGLGLAMVSHIVEAHRGKVEVDSKEGAGSTFRILLPEKE
jgi:signal transduction histidine kinase